MTEAIDKSIGPRIETQHITWDEARKQLSLEQEKEREEKAKWISSQTWQRLYGMVRSR